jgi:hypothetical protein
MPPGPKYPKGISELVDVQPEYEGQSICSPSAKPGTRKLMAILTATYGSAYMGTWRACSTSGVSEHKDGRAIDWMQSSHVASQRKHVEAFIKWATARDTVNRVLAANARRLGIMYLVWDNRMWRAYQPESGWLPYNNCLAKSMKGGANDTSCHRNHLHISLTWDGASGLTSFYSLKAVADPYCRTWSASSPSPKRAAGAFHSVKSMPLVVDSRNGVGVTTGWGQEPGPCRLAASRWQGDQSVLPVPVLGYYGIPFTNVADVRVKLFVVQPNAPGRLRVWGGGKTPSGILESSAKKWVTMNVPVASDGSINVAVSLGATHVVMRVLGYRSVVGAKPTPTPTPTATVTPTP